MFEQKDSRFWNEKEINYGLLTERWKTSGKSQLKNLLESLTKEDLKEIHRVLQLAPPLFEDKPSYLEQILPSSHAMQVYLLTEFFKKFRKSVIEYIKKRNPGIAISDREFIQLFRLFVNQTEDHLLNIFIFHNWNAASTGTIFNSSTPLPTDVAVQFNVKANGFAKKLSSKDWYHGKKTVRFIGSFDSIFIFDKQIGDKLVQTTSGHKRVKPSRYVLIKIQSSFIEIREVRRPSKFIADSIKKIFESQLSIELIDETLSPVMGNLNTFLHRITNSVDRDEFEVIGLRVRRSKLDKGVPVEIDNFSDGSDITKAIAELIERGIIVIDNLSDIDRFTVSFSRTGQNGKRKTVIIKENEDGSLILILNGKELKDNEREEFSNIFTQRFGIDLNIPLDPTQLAPNQKAVFNYLLSEGRVNNPRTFQLDAISTLHQKKILLMKKQFRLKCSNSNCRHSMYSSNESDLCRDCESQANKIYDSYKLEISENGIQKYTHDLMTRSEKFIVRTPRVIQIKKTQFKLHEIAIENKPVFLYFNFKRVSKTFLEYLVRSGLPILFINITRVVNTTDMEEKLFEQIELSEILIEENTGLTKIEEKISSLRAYSVDRISNAARSSYDNINEKIQQLSEYAPKEFETDVFNIIKQIFPSAYRAGGKYVPEGFVGLEYQTAHQTHKRVFEWDCKLALLGNYNLDQSEIDKASRYIRSTIESDELKNFNKKLNHYIIITNSVDPANFKNFAGSLNRKRKWTGEKSVVLFFADAVIELHSQYAQYQNEILRRPNVFFAEFFKMLLKVEATKGYCEIRKENISTLFQTVIALPVEHPELNGANVEEHLQRDED
jgi:hypothetical protein